MSERRHIVGPSGQEEMEKNKLIKLRCSCPKDDVSLSTVLLSSLFFSGGRVQ